MKHIDDLLRVIISSYTRTRKTSSQLTICR